MSMINWDNAPLPRRRERIATAALQAVVKLMPAAPNGVIARQAVGLADALIAQLDKEEVP